jgi:signal transduction histidine kinase
VRKRVLESFIRHRWGMLGLGAFLMFLMELFELLIPENKLARVLELIVNLTTFIMVVVLIVLLSRAIQAKNNLIEILNAKHQLSLELASYGDWESFTSALVQFPGKVVAVERTAVLIRESVTNRFEPSARWSQPGAKRMDEMTEVCQSCISGILDETGDIRPCKAFFPAVPDECYCIPLRLGRDTVAVLQIKLQSGVKLSSEQMSIFSYMSDELAISLKANQDRKILAELKVLEASLAERRTVLDYLHDNLCQNLGYLRLKLDQLRTERFSPEDYRMDIERMKDAADDSYEIVRGILETNYPETTSTVDNLLQEHTRKFSKRSGIEVQLATAGQPVPVSPDIQRAVFFVFQEVLRNIEKHARATKVDICIEWCTSNLSVSVTDNGIGFDPQSTEPGKHFGFEIMRERLARANGVLTVESIENAGTTIRYTLPLESTEKARPYHG